jgi:hypothetical protein
MMRLYGLFGLSLICFSLVVVVGCGGPARPKMAKVSGTVTLDGQPLEGAQVVFIAAGAPRNATGTTDATGKFTLTTFEANDGAVLGEHSITVSKSTSSAPAMSADDPAGGYGAAMSAAGGGDATMGGSVKSVLPAKYGEAKQSGLKHTVTDGANDVKLELTSK